MYRLNHILSHLTSSSLVPKKCHGKGEVTSLDIFEFMNAILNGGSGGGVNEIALRDKVKLRKVFDKMDLDGSGDLDRNEFSKAARLCSMVLTDDEIDNVFSKIAEGGNRINMDQFGEAIESLANSVKVDYKKFQQLDKDKKLVIALWDKHMNGNKRAAQMFTKKLRASKSLKGLDKIDLDRQVQMVYGMVSNAVRALTDVDRLVARLEKEGKRHYYTFKLTDRQYEAVKSALFETLPEIMKDDYDFYTQMQYEKYVNIIIGAMIKGYNDR